MARVGRRQRSTESRTTNYTIILWFQAIIKGKWSWHGWTASANAAAVLCCHRIHMNASRQQMRRNNVPVRVCVSVWVLSINWAKAKHECVRVVFFFVSFSFRFFHVSNFAGNKQWQCRINVRCGGGDRDAQYGMQCAVNAPGDASKFQWGGRKKKRATVKWQRFGVCLRWARCMCLCTQKFNCTQFRQQTEQRTVYRTHFSSRRSRVHISLVAVSFAFHRCFTVAPV